MKKLILILGSAALGLAVYLVLNAPETAISTAPDELDEAASQVGRWGAKQRVTGAGNTVSGHLKDAVGTLSGDDQLRAEGTLDNITGAVKDAAGKVAATVEDAVHE